MDVAPGTVVTFIWDLPAQSWPGPDSPPNLDWTGSVTDGVVTCTRESNLGCGSKKILTREHPKHTHFAAWNCENKATWEVTATGGDGDATQETDVTLEPPDSIRFFYDVPDIQVPQINYCYQINNGTVHVIGVAAHGQTNPLTQEGRRK